MIDIFDRKKIKLNDITCHSGGAEGSDTYWENIGEDFGIKTKAYSYKTRYHDSKNKVEISDDDFKEGILEVGKANKSLNRYGINRYINLLARNWSQVKYSDEIFAIGSIIKVGDRGSRGYNRGKYEMVDGGTAYAIQMGINNHRSIYVFDQNRDSWFRWSYSALRFIETQIPKISTQNFAGIGTREIKQNGIKAIQDVYNLTFK